MIVEILVGAAIGTPTGVLIGLWFSYREQSQSQSAFHAPKVKNIRTMKHHERASLIRHGWMTPDGKWTDKGMPKGPDPSP